MFRDAGVQPMEYFRMDVRYWSRADCDNCVIKRLVDTLRSEQLVPQDDKRYFKGFSVTPDPDLRHNTYLIAITDLTGTSPAGASAPATTS